EVPIEASMRQPGVVHQVGHAHPVDSVLAKAGPGDADDLFVVLAFVRSRMAHARCLLRWFLTP
ncbi:MAG: hypothetical protein ACHQ3P_07155, partial [Candidatus Limnocylindrales bacterium]